MADNPNQPASLPPAAIDALGRGQTIEAIKIVRREQGLDLRDAKQAVDRYLEDQPHLKRKRDEVQAESRRGCMTWAAVILALLAIGYYALSGR